MNPEKLFNQPPQEQSKQDEKGLSQEKERVEMTRINEYIDSVLEGEDQSLIERPMEKECKVAVMIPAYNESPDNILRSLGSLVSQEGVTPEAFEVDIIINNRKKDAQTESEAYLANQRAIQLINFINNQADASPEGLTEEQLDSIEAIRKSGLRINAIDKSSESTAYEENNVGIARDRAGAELSRRFLLADKGVNGVIALADCDSVFSQNYIKALIDSFEEHQVNGVAGNLEFEVDPNLPHKDVVQRAFNIYMGFKESETDYSGMPTFVEKDDGVLMSGTNMAVTVRSMGLAGGIPHQAGGEDIRFGKRVEALDGKVANNYDYTVTSLIRVSERTGVQGMGRMVKRISESVEAFYKGESDSVFIEDKEGVFGFYEALLKAQKSETLTGAFIAEQMKVNRFKKHPLTEIDFNTLADAINEELSKPEKDQDVKKVEAMILEKISPYYPEKDITSELDIER